METRREVIGRTAVLADELGYEILSVAEGWALDSTLLLAEIAGHTRRIKLATGVLSVWGRSPGTLAMTAATLQLISGGRFVLGLGASTKQLAEGFHDVPYVHPARRLRQVISNVRPLLAGGRAQLQAVPMARPLRLGQPPSPEPPIWIAAMAEQSVRVAAELADGWYPLYVDRDRCATWAAELNEIRATAGLRTLPLTVAAGPVATVDDDLGSARAVVASYHAWYMTAMGDYYARLVAAQGFATEVELVVAANPRPNPMQGVVPEEAQVLLDRFSAHGTAGAVRDQIEQWDPAVDIVMVILPPGLPWPTIESTVRAAAP